MKVFIVYAHPEPQSFNGALKDLAVQTLGQAGHQLQISDLYAMKFEAAGGPADFTELEDPACFRYQREQMRATAAALFVPQLKNEMDKLLWADFVLFQFPLWWFSLPAILKGWVDRVFAMGFSYSIGRAYENGIFRGKKAMLSFTTGSPPSTYGPAGKNGRIEDLVRHIQYGMLHFIGMDVLPPFIAYSAARVPLEQRQAYLEDYRRRLLAIESTDPIDFDRAAEAAG